MPWHRYRIILSADVEASSSPWARLPKDKHPDPHSAEEGEITDGLQGGTEITVRGKKELRLTGVRVESVKHIA